MKKSYYLVFAIFSTLGMLAFPYSHASEKPIELMNEVIYNGTCTSLEEDIGTGLVVSPILLTDCSLTMLWSAMVNQILLDNQIIDKRIF